MKRLDAPQRKDFRPLKLNGADLGQLLETLAPCEGVTLVADNIEYESTEEFVGESRGRIPRQVTITAREPFLVIEFRRHSASLYVSKSDLIGSGLFAKLCAQIEAFERRPRFLYSYWYAIASTGLLQVAFNLPFLKPYEFLVVWLLSASVVWIFWVAFVQLRRFAFIQPLGSSDARTFWRRNADNTIVAVLAALLGALVGAAATKMADRMWPNNNAGPAAPANIAPASSSASQPSAPTSKQQ